MTNPFRRFFEETEEVSAADLTDCHEVIEFGKTVYYNKFMEYLERGADEPLKIGDPMTMIQSAARVNAFKEIKAHLKRQLKTAHELVEKSNEEALGG